MSDGLKETTFTATNGRDAGKVFLITELPAIQADEWAHELLYEASMAGMNLKNVDVLELDTKSMKGMIELGSMIVTIIGRIPGKRSRELKFELLNRCVQIVPKGGHPRMVIWEDEIKEAATFTILFGQVLKLHLDFLKQGET